MRATRTTRHDDARDPSASDVGSPGGGADDDGTSRVADLTLRTAVDGTITDVSRSVTDLLGWTPENLVGTASRELFLDRGLTTFEDFAAMLRAGDETPPAEVRLRSSTGDLRWMVVSAAPLRNLAGTIIGCEIRARDAHAEVVARRAARTLSAGNEILVRATTEAEVLDGMCEAAVREGGYVFAWYGRPVLDERQSIEVLAATPEHASYLDEVEISWADVPFGRGPVGIAIRTGRTHVLNDGLAALSFAPWCEAAARHGFLSSIGLPVIVDGEIDGAFIVYAGETHAYTDDTIAVLEDLATQVGLGLERIRSYERLEQASAERAVLATAIDQTAESVVITDVNGRVAYANPAALASGGRDADTVIGHSSTVFDDIDDVEANAGMRATVARGVPWVGTLSRRLPDGSEAEVELSVSPVHDASGAHIAFVAVGRDVTTERSLEADLTRAHSERAAIASVIDRVQPVDSLEHTIGSFTDAVCLLDGIDRAVVLLARADGSVHRAAFGGRPVATIASESTATIDEILSVVVTSDGPVVFDLDREEDRQRLRVLEEHVGDALRSQGFHAVAYTPIHTGPRIIGLIGYCSLAENAVEVLSDRTGILRDLGSYAGSIFTQRADEQNRREALEDAIRDTIDAERFHAVFQPVVDLRTEQVVGYEALTRFDDATRPDLRFTEAHEVGLGMELEAACVRRALDDARDLPPEAFLGINFAPSTIISGDAARAIAGYERQVFIEITEHAKIESYATLTAALSECSGALVSVDDAGAGYASLQHILELKPDCVKLDIGLVHGIDRDPARQALVAGLRHFGELTGTELLAEGIETRAEADVLVALGVQYGQGFLFGRPEPIG